MELIEADVLQKESANVAKKQRKKNTMDDESWNWEGRRLGNANLFLYYILKTNFANCKQQNF